MKEYRIHARFDIKLKDIMKQHCKCHNITMTQFITEAIAKQLNITLNDDGTVNEEEYAKTQINEINKCIKELEKKKEKYKEVLQ